MTTASCPSRPRWSSRGRRTSSSGPRTRSTGRSATTSSRFSSATRSQPASRSRSWTGPAEHPVSGQRKAAGVATRRPLFFARELRSSGRRGGSRLDVHHRRRDGGEALVGRPLLLENRLEALGGGALAEQGGQRAERTVGGDLVVL